MMEERSLWRGEESFELVSRKRFDFEGDLFLEVG